MTYFEKSFRFFCFFFVVGQALQGKRDGTKWLHQQAALPSCADLYKKLALRQGSVSRCTQGYPPEKETTSVGSTNEQYTKECSGNDEDLATSFSAFDTCGWVGEMESHDFLTEHFKIHVPAGAVSKRTLFRFKEIRLYLDDGTEVTVLSGEPHNLIFAQPLTVTVFDLPRYSLLRVFHSRVDANGRQDPFLDETEASRLKYDRGTEATFSVSSFSEVAVSAQRWWTVGFSHVADFLNQCIRGPFYVHYRVYWRPSVDRHSMIGRLALLVEVSRNPEGPTGHQSLIKERFGSVDTEDRSPWQFYGLCHRNLYVELEMYNTEKVKHPEKGDQLHYENFHSLAPAYKFFFPENPSHDEFFNIKLKPDHPGQREYYGEARTFFTSTGKHVNPFTVSL